jgi:hypothetical protein
MSYNSYFETSVGFQLSEAVVGELAKKVGRPDKLLFGETSASIIVSAQPEKLSDMKDALARHGLNAIEIGVTGGERLDFGLFQVETDAAVRAYEGALKPVFATAQG